MPHISQSPFEGSVSPVVVLTTSIVALVSGFLLGVYSIRGYLVSPDLKEERERYWKDPVESDESDIDEDDTILDHAPNWANGEEADRRQGLRAATAKATTAAAPKPAEQQKKIKEECKLVLVVRTDLGMTKGSFPLFPSPPRPTPVQ
jgi:PTH2 family peptidyl-tRNA hydrolase